MRTSRFTDEQIIGIVREYEAGAKLTELCRRHNVSLTTFYKWRAKYGGMAVSDAKRLRALEEENRRLKQLLGTHPGTAALYACRGSGGWPLRLV